jgi:hypothetical protein
MSRFEALERAVVLAFLDRLAAVVVELVGAVLTLFRVEPGAIA